ncbi:MAG: amino acid adenylation domain-containing protein, partial [Acidobacteriota bacterium]
MSEWAGFVHPSAAADQLSHHLFEAQSERTPDSIALLSAGQALSYQELNWRANRIAGQLRRLGVGPDERAALCLQRSPDMAAAVLGVLKAGGAYMPLDPSYPSRRLAFMLRDSRSTVLLADESSLRNLPALKVPGQQLLNCSWAAAGSGKEANPEIPVHPHNVAYVIYTSGSTGRPKGVAMRHEALANLIAWQRTAEGFDRPRVTLQFAPLSFDVSFQEFFSAWNSASAVLLTDEETRRDPRALLRQLCREEAERLFLPATALQALADASQHLPSFPPLRQVLSAGEQLQVNAAVRSWLAAMPGCTLSNHYGPTESHVVTAFTLSGAPGNWPALPSIGRPIDNAQAILLDSQFQPVAPGVSGEVFLGGASLARGYWSRPALTAESFLPNPYSPRPGSRLYRTGDLARHWADGTIQYLGRIDVQVKVRGFRIEPGEVEVVLSGHRGVEEAVVVAGGQRLVASVVGRGVGEGDRRRERREGTQRGAEKSSQRTLRLLSASSAVSPPDLRQYLKDRLPEFMLPAFFVVLDELPLTPSGKVDRRALPAPEKSLDRGPSATPRTPIEEELVRIWCELLEIDRVGIQDDFFELGGHSLLATRAVSQIYRSFEVELPLRALFEERTIAGLAGRINESSPQESRRPPIEPLAQREGLPLSFGQQRLWFLDRLMPDNAFYNLTGSWELEGPLDVAALEASLREIVRRHEALRTRFPSQDGTPLQVISPEAQLSVDLIDLSSLDDSRRRAAAQQLAVEEGETPFDLSSGPLLRATLLRLGRRRHAMLLTLHHIVADGWSIGVLIQEQAALYTAILQGRPSSLPELPIQYADFAVWQRKWMQGEVLEEQLGYWERNLSDAPVLEMPTDRPRPAIQAFRGAHLEFLFPAQLSDRLRAMCRQRGVTLYMALLAAFQTLLHRYTSQTDIVVGTTIANRNHPQTESLIGLFINILAMRGRLSADSSFSELLEQTSETALQAYTHQDLPFEKLVERLQPERDQSRNPIFQVMFALQNIPLKLPEMTGLTVRPMPVDARTTRFDLEVHVWEREDGLDGFLFFDRDLFDRSSMSRLMGHYRRLLECIVSDPDQRISELRLMSPAQRHQLVEWSGSQRPLPERPVVDGLFEEIAQQSPDAVALACGDRQISYGELNRASGQMAASLRQRGLGPEVCAALLMERGLDLYTAMLGVLKAGGAYLPLDPAQPDSRLAYMLQDAQAAGVLTETELQGRLSGFQPDPQPQERPHPCGLWNLSLLLSENPDPKPEAEPAGMGALPAGPDNLAYVMYTSGSTGQPKGVTVTHRSIVRLVRNTGFAEFGPNQVFLQLAPVSFDASTLEIWGPLLNGGRLEVPPPSRRSLHQLGEDIQRLGVSTLWLSAGLFHQMVEENLHSLKPVRQLLAGGDILSPAHVRRALAELPSTRLINGYGPTENTTFTCCHPMQGEQIFGGTVPIGRPISNTRICLLGRNGRQLPAGAAGELWIGGAGLARGYLNRPALTAEKFRPDPLGASGSRLYRSGDLVRFLSDGTVHFLGRIDHQVKVRGFRVEPGEVEAAIRRHPEVRQAAVVALPDKRLVAYVVEGEGRNRTGRRGGAQRSKRRSSQRPLRLPSAPSAVSPPLSDFLSQLLPEYMVPSFFVFLDELPLTPNGKLDRKALPAPQPPEGEGQIKPPRNPVEARLAKIWQDVLECGPVGVDDNFFELGGHSLLATRAVSKIQKLFGLELPLRTLFDSPTVAALADWIERAAVKSPPPPIEPLSRDQELPLSFAQQRMWFLDRLTPGNPFYNIPVAWRLSGRLDVSALCASLDEIVRRHEALRTHFPSRSGHPRQSISAPRGLPLPLLDLSGLPISLRDREARRVTRGEARRPFQLDRGPLLRTVLVLLEGKASGSRLQASEPESEKTSDLGSSSDSPSLLTTDNCRLTTDSSCLLMLTMHHAISDGWSMEVLVRELTTLYSAFAVGSWQFGKGGSKVQSPRSKVFSESGSGTCSLQPTAYSLSQASSLPPLPIQYPDYAAWQRNWLRGEVLERQLSYWTRQLQGTPSLNLPTDRPRPKVRAYRGGQLQFLFSPQLLQSLEALSLKQGATPFMTLLAALQALLCRQSGQDDVAVGTPIANRTQPEVEGLIGFFANTLVMRARLSPGDSFLQQLNQVSESAFQAYAHQDLPFEKLVEHLQVERDLSRNPIFQVLLAFQNIPDKALQLPGLQVEGEPVEMDMARFDLSLYLAQSESGLEGFILYDREIFDRTTVLRLVRQYENLLGAIAENPSRKLEEMPLGDAAQLHQLLLEWNDAPLSAQLEEGCLHQLFEAWAERVPDQIGLICEGSCLSYAELNRRADGLAGILQSKGLSLDGTVGLALERSLEIVLSILAVLKAGGAYLPLNPDLPSQRLELLLEEARPDLLLGNQALLPPMLGPGPAVLALETVWPDLGDASWAHSQPMVQPENLAYLLFTSGSTGRPKGVAVEHRHIAQYVRAAAERLKLPRSASYALVSTFSADLGNTSLFGSLAGGGTLHILSQEASTDPAAWDAYCRRNPIDCLKIVPTHLAALEGGPERNWTLPRQRLVLGGESCSLQWLEELQSRVPDCVVFNHYGPSETTVGVLAGRVDPLDPSLTGSPPLGRPLAGSEVYILDPSLHPVPLGAAGELCIGGAQLARGYLNRPGRTAESFLPNALSGAAGQRLYRSGDLARQAQDGQLEFLGRIDKQLNVRGFRVEPGEVEEALRSYPTVQEAAVAASPDPSGNQRLVAYVVGDEGAAPSAEELEGFLKEILPSYMLPSLFVHLDRLPLTPNGKLDRQALPAPDAALRQGEEFVAPRDHIEAILARVFKEVLALERVSVHDNFFNLGGHSLLATQAISRVRQAFELELPLRTLFEAPSVAALAGRIEKASPQAPPPPIVRLEHRENLPLSFAQQRLWFLDRLTPGNPFYNVPAAWSIKGELDVEALRASLQEIVQRHDSLRTCFPHQQGLPRQVVSPPRPIDLPLVDLQGLDPAAAHRQAEALMEAEARYTFDLANGPLFRVALLMLEAGGSRATGRDDLGPRTETGSRFQVPGFGSLSRAKQESALHNLEPGARNPEPAPSSEQRTTNCELPTDPSGLPTDPSASPSSCLLPP